MYGFEYDEFGFLVENAYDKGYADAIDFINDNMNRFMSYMDEMDTLERSYSVSDFVRTIKNEL